MDNIDDYLKPLEVNDERLSSLTVELAKTFRHLAWHSDEQFLTTPINVLPTGLETGRFLAIDIGGSNLRVAFINLLGEDLQQGSKTQKLFLKRWPIEDRIKNDQASDLFSWIGDCIAEVVQDFLNQATENGTRSIQLEEEVPMGITFSFPMIQKSISEARLMPMGKGFAITSDLDLGGLLLQGYSKHLEQSRTPRLPKLKIVAIANDSVSTLATLAYYTGSKTSNSRTSLGLIMGTGANAALAIPRAHLPSSKLDTMTLPASIEGHPIIIANTEFTLRGVGPTLKALGLQTKWDRDLDAETETPGFQPFEYMTSGRYIGELVRLIFNSYVRHAHKVDIKVLPEPFQRRNGFPTKFLSDTAQFRDPEQWQKALQASFPGLGLNSGSSTWEWTDETASVLMKIAKAVQVRSSRLIASAVAGLLACAGELRMQDTTMLDENDTHEPQELVVAYAGGVIESYPGYLESCQNTLDELVASLHTPTGSAKVVLSGAKDSGVVGAGILAGTVWNLNS